MPKFSIIIPVYNTSKYLKKCLDSVFNQSFKDFEVIAVNDGSTDDSLDILNEYDVKIINQKNQGLSMARNNGIEASSGEYFILLDSDDYIEKDLLLNLNDSIKNNPDLVRFQIKQVENNKVVNYEEESFTDLNGIEAFHKIVNYHFVENAWSYLYKKDYFMKNEFYFKPNMLHEDYGLIPYVIIKANKVNSISYLGYDYVQRKGSIMNDKTYEKEVKKCYDVLEQYLSIIDKSDDKIYKSFLANSLIMKTQCLKKVDLKKFIGELKKEKVFDNILDDTLARKLKKTILKIDPRLYYRR